jgi:hypothetical protein
MKPSIETDQQTKEMFHDLSFNILAVLALPAAAALSFGIVEWPPEVMILSRC